MQLKKIILKGFKSFPEKTVLEFNEGVTAIVGPNGSGKSNIIEAIRWVMGEQSAKTLRGDRMNDVIFSGTHERKPLNIAEVELILDNSDSYLDIEYEEVSVLRRLSRSGDSTYMINQQECRLRDIIDLFMDSGLGKESFSVISQGRVEAIFNSKPEERRGIFEEAAGVYKYKVRKQEAEKKLGQTQENLDRVQDILYELEAQLEPLRRQADIARSYLEHKEKLTDLDIGVTVWQIENLAKTVAKDKADLAKITEELSEIDGEIEKLEQKRAQQQKNHAEIETAREQLNKELIEIVREKERTEAALNLFDEKARHREEFIGEKLEAIKNLEARKERLQKEMADIEAAYSEQNDALTKINQEIKKLEEQRDYLAGDKEAQMEELRSQYIELLQKQTSLRNEKSYLEQEVARAQREADKNQASVSQIQENVEEYERLVETKRSAYQQVSEELLSLLNEYQSAEADLGSYEERMQTHNQRVAQTRHELERAKAKESSLLEMQENYAGYYAGVRAVMQQKADLAGIVGTVAELIKIPNDYIAAIDTVLGSSGQFIVVENEKNGREAINFLKQAKKGRATFLPLTTIRPRTISPQIKKQIAGIDGYVGIASELVSFDEKVSSIVENLLGQTIVATTLQEANKIARLIQYKNRVVSLEGDIINAGGSMTGGGRQNNASPIFSQKAELEQLAKFIAENEKVIEQLIVNREKVAKEKDQLEQRVSEVRLAGEEKRLEEQQLKSEVANAEELLRRFKRELEATTFEVNESTHLSETYVQRLKETEIALIEINQQVDTCNENMRILSSEQENIDSEREKIADAIEEKREARNEIRETLAMIRTNLQHHKNQLADAQEQIREIELDIKSFDEELEVDSKEELEELYVNYAKKQEKVESSQVTNRQKLEEITRLIDDLTTEIARLSGRNKYLIEQKNILDIALSKNDVRMDHLLEYLAEEYKISYEEARLLEKPELGLEEAQKQVRLLKKGIEELGPVNLNSIDEFKSVNERYEFLSKQQNDLIEAKANLYNTMDEMDLIVEKQFKETFDRIQREFSSVFPKMFGGGHAELVLNDPSNLLETGIEIIAQPPGKRLTRLSLLSGGERALTAISLLFAIIQVNPIPFCILDEAEAALDDANVVRFGRYLENFEYDTQFIVITHRKGTMEHSDQLYGVTMQEKGISKIVSVTLSEAQQMEGVT